MIYFLELEKLYENMDEATVGQWLFSEGELVSKGDLLVQVVADKMSEELIAPENAFLRKIFIPEKSQVPFGVVLAVLSDLKDEEININEIEQKNQSKLEEWQNKNTISLDLFNDTKKATVNKKEEKAKISWKAAPAARIFARNNEVDLQEVADFYGKNTIHKKDVEDFLAAQKTSSAETTFSKLELSEDSAEKPLALLTGASGGIGMATALQLAKNGYNLALQYRSGSTEFNSVVEACKDSGAEVLLLQVDLLEENAAEQLIKNTLDSFSKLDVLICSAGILQDAPIAFMKDAQWEDVLNLNLTVPFKLTRAAAMPMARQRTGRIVYLSSDAARLGSANRANYAAAKAGLLGLMRSAAREMAGLGITVNAVCPGFVDTAMTENIPENRKKELYKGIPLRRFAKAEEVAELICFLASEKSAYITGQQYSIDGGLFMG